MNDQQKRLVYFLAALILIAALLRYWLRIRAAQIEAAVTPPPGPDFYAPYFWPSPGIYPETAPFESTVNVYVDNPLAGALAYQYIPVFGLVGMVGVNG